MTTEETSLKEGKNPPLAFSNGDCDYFMIAFMASFVGAFIM